MSKNVLDALGEVLTGNPNVLILPHNDPDPDAIGAAVGLNHLLKEIFQVDSWIAYKGLIERAENKALVQYLRNPLKIVNQTDFQAASMIALVDTQPGAGNNSLPPNKQADIVIDHHILQPAPKDVLFSDIRPELGSTSTILTNYLQEAGLEPSAQLATALFFGIKTDTRGLSRNANPSDVNAYFYLQSRVDVNALAQIEQAQVPLEYFQSIDAAIHAAKVFDENIVIAYLGKLSYPDLGAELADFFMRLKGVQWVLCMGVFRGELILSMRSRNKKIGAGKLITQIIGDKGTAGGHGNMSAGHIELAKEDDPQQMALYLEKTMLINLKGTPDVEHKRIIGL
ncbi:MAG: DHH family phosphoesterase [Anaerolineales bacterium]